MAIPRTASVDMIRMSTKDDPTTQIVGRNTQEMLTLPGRVHDGLAAEYNSNHRKGSQFLHSQSHSEFAKRQDRRAERQEARSENNAGDRDPADLPGIRRLRWPHSVSP